jgi:hypothetical protein
MSKVPQGLTAQRDEQFLDTLEDDELMNIASALRGSHGLTALRASRRSRNARKGH